MYSGWNASQRDLTKQKIECKVLITRLMKYCIQTPIIKKKSKIISHDYNIQELRSDQ